MLIIGSYVLTDRRTGKFYVGSSGNVRKRIDTHVRDLNHGNHHCQGLQSLWGSNAVLIETVFPTETREEAYELEQDIIDRYLNSPMLLNIGMGVKGGDNLTRHPNREDIVRRTKEALKKYLISLTPLEKKLLYGLPGARNGMWGRSHTTETRAKISEANLGITRRSGFVLSEDHRKKISEHARRRVGNKNPFFGKKHTDETRQRISELMKAKETLPSNTRRIEAEGKEFISLTEASRHLGVSPALMVYRINKGKQGYRYIS